MTSHPLLLYKEPLYANEHQTCDRRYYSCSFEFSESLITKRVNYVLKQKLNYHIRSSCCLRDLEQHSQTCFGVVVRKFLNLWCIFFLQITEKHSLFSYFVDLHCFQLVLRNVKCIPRSQQFVYFKPRLSDVKLFVLLLLLKLVAVRNSDFGEIAVV
jgi:hypothetical protein